jgi:hypothetical protein
MRSAVRLCIIGLVFCLALAACGGPLERSGKGAGKSGSMLKPAAAKLAAPHYHSPAGRWRAEHGGLVALNTKDPGAGFELGECLLCHQIGGCNACHAYTGARRLPQETWR